MSLPIPIINLPFLYINDLKITRASTTTLSIGTGQCRDSTNVIDMTVTAAITIDSAVTGANGIDTGTFAASKMYNVFLLGDAYSVNSPAGIISLSATPTMPAGYNAYRLIGHWASNGSTVFNIGSSVGSGNCRDFYYDTMPALLSGGSATSLTGISLANVVPAFDNIPVHLHVEFTPATASDNVRFTPYGSTATVIRGVSGSVAAKVNTGYLTVVSKLSTSTPTILYINSAASGASSVWLDGFRYYI